MRIGIINIKGAIFFFIILATVFVRPVLPPLIQSPCISTKTAEYIVDLEGLPASDDAKFNDTFLVAFDHQWHCQRSFYTLHTCVFSTFLNSL